MSEQTSGKSWRCLVCGYVHRGDTPPEVCIICGAPQDKFEEYDDPLKKTAETEYDKWKCLICNYVHEAKEAPDNCPVCSAEKNKFEPVIPDVKRDISIAKDKTVIVAGGGIAGISAVESIREVSGGVKIILVTKEDDLPYYRLNLTRLLAGEIKPEELPIHSESWYKDKNIKLISGTEVSGISPEDKKIELIGGSEYKYDKLILTTGSHPFVPPLQGMNREGVTPLRTLDDARYVLENIDNGKSVVIIGGGILGLEAAGALVNKAGSVTILEHYDYLMPRQLNNKAAALLEDHIETLGIKLKKGVSVKEIAGDERVRGVVLGDGETVQADLVIVTAGVRPNSYLARLCGLHVDCGIIVDDTMQTSDPDIYAAGDIAEHRGTLYGLWGPAQFQGSIAGMNAIGLSAEFGGIPRSNTIKVLGIDLFSIGIIEPDDGSYIVTDKVDNGEYQRFIFRDTHLVGAILFGDTDLSAEVKMAVEEKKDFSALLSGELTSGSIIESLRSN